MDLVAGLYLACIGRMTMQSSGAYGPLVSPSGKGALSGLTHFPSGGRCSVRIGLVRSSSGSPCATWRRTPTRVALRTDPVLVFLLWMKV